MKKGEEGIITDIKIIKGTNGTKHVSIKIENSKYLIVGSKLYARNASQKGTIGQIRNDKDMPYIKETGQIVDIIFNVNAIPSRMTAGYLLELLFGILTENTGKRIDGLIYEDPNYDMIKRILLQYGYSTMGSIMMNPKTGTQFQSQIYTGPGLIGILNKFPEETVYSRGIGDVNKESRQPTRGRTEEGASMFSWMEVNAAVSAGIASILNAQNCGKSDATEVVVCLNCSRIASIIMKTVGQAYLECRNCGTKFDLEDYYESIDNPGGRVIIPIQQEDYKLYLRFKIYILDLLFKKKENIYLIYKKD